MQSLISTLLLVVLIYCLLGVLFSIVFLAKGIVKVDEATKGSSWVFKLLIFPGMTVLWPVFLRKWLKKNRYDS